MLECVAIYCGAYYIRAQDIAVYLVLCFLNIYIGKTVYNHDSQYHQARWPCGFVRTE